MNQNSFCSDNAGFVNSELFNYYRKGQPLNQLHFQKKLLHVHKLYTYYSFYTHAKCNLVDDMLVFAR